MQYFTSTTFGLWCVIVVFPDHTHLLSFAIILKRNRELVALLLLSYGSLVAVNVLWLFLAVQLVGLWCVIVV